jgi:hypothetical protein
MKPISIALAVIIAVVTPFAHGEDKIRKAIEDGLVTKAFLDTLTHDDVPEKWRERIEEEEKDKYFLRTYFRGDRKALTVMWAKGWIDDKAKMFVATIYDGETRISKIAHIGDSSSIFPADSDDGYKQIVSLKDDGTVMIVITHENGYLEGIEVKGRESNLMNDLEYTKAAISMESIVGPLLESITEQLDATPKKQKKKDKNRDKPCSGEDETITTEQGGADQPATAPESKSGGNSKPQPDSEGRSQ